MNTYNPKKIGPNAMLQALTAVVLVCCGAFLMSSCEKKGPAEKAGEKIDDATEEVGDAIKDATN
jgi:hypothetical protein